MQPLIDWMNAKTDFYAINNCFDAEKSNIGTFWTHYISILKTAKNKTAHKYNTYKILKCVGDTGLEPVTSCMSSKHSNHLS